MNDSSQTSSNPSGGGVPPFRFSGRTYDRTRVGVQNRKPGALGPTMPSRTPLQTAMALDSGRQADRLNERSEEGAYDEGEYGDDSVLSDDSAGTSSPKEEGGEGSMMGGEGESSVLDLPSRSYARRETSEGEEEQKRQQNLLDVRNRFFGKGSSSESMGEGMSGRQNRQSSRGEGVAQRPQRNERPSGGISSSGSRFQSQLSRSRAQDSKMQEKMDGAESLKRSIQQTQKLASTASKAFSAATSETILPLFWLIFVLNAETLNTLLRPRLIADLPERLKEALRLAGLDLSVDEGRWAGVARLLLWLTTAFVDIVIFLVIVAAILPLLFVISMVLLEAFGIISIMSLVTGK